MQTQDNKANLIDQIETFLPDTDDDTIVAQYTLINGLIDQRIRKDSPQVESFENSAEEGRNDDYRYFLDLNTVNPPPIVGKAHALDGLQEGIRRLLNQLRP